MSKQDRRKRHAKTLIAALVALPLAGAAVAGGFGGHGKSHDGPGCGMGKRHAVGGDHRGAHVEGRIAFLKAELGITEAQEADWQKFEQVMREDLEQRGERQEMRREMRRDGEATPAPDRIARHVERMEARLERMKTMQSAVADLYAALAPEQQQAANQLLPGGHGRHMR